MLKKRAVTLCAAILLVSVGTYAHASLKTLLELGRNQANIAKSMKRENKNYNRVKKAVISGKIEEGIPAKKILKKFGKPIFDNIYDEKRSAYKWLYMPSTSTHFEGEKIYLFVDKDDKLVGWKVIE